MTEPRRRPGAVRDAILAELVEHRDGLTVAEIRRAVALRLDGAVAASSVRSYLNINTPETFERMSRGRYRLRASS